MKTKHVLAALCGLFMIGASACCADGCKTATTKYSELPTPTKQFLGKYFAGEKVKTVIVDTEDAITEYDVYFVNGTKAEVNANGDWESVENKTASVPVTMLPEATQAYIATNYATETVVKVEKDAKGYDVKFASGKELEFNTQGAFVKVD